MRSGTDQGWPTARDERRCRVKQMSIDQRRALVANVEALAATGKSRREISEQLNVPSQRVSTICSSLGLATVRKHHRSQAFRESTAQRAIKILFDDPQQSDAEIGRRLSASREYIGQVRAWMSINGIHKSGGVA